MSRRAMFDAFWYRSLDARSISQSTRVGAPFRREDGGVPRESDRVGRGAVALWGLDALQLPDRVRGNRLVEDRLLEDSADDGADLAAGAHRVC